jgi:hypothetical protein
LTKRYKIGSTLAIKFQLADASGIYIGTAKATLAIIKKGNGIDTTDTLVDLTSAGSSDTGNIFRYDTTSQQYMYNLKTTGYSQGTYQIIVSLDDGTQITTYFEMSK